MQQQCNDLTLLSGLRNYISHRTVSWSRWVDMVMLELHAPRNAFRVILKCILLTATVKSGKVAELAVSVSLAVTIFQLSMLL
ncbi:hypothetical protein CEXT_307731 [Caerostris extrusa]|uniref:Uncharacterized protein n=1 Tax=Caerostris extrusa TaxID=172846 RepID=A0AAV4UAF5_CAEEX|nr:hypothetical protein CEXT_307731 [Caerostris extrusa]